MTDKPMTKAEYRRAIEALGLNQVQAGKFLGISDRTSRRWAAGTRPVFPTVEILLRYMLRRRISPKAVNPGWES
jgi:hypothetical protein